MFLRRLLPLTFAGLLTLAGCQKETADSTISTAETTAAAPTASGAAQVDDTRLRNAKQEPGQWLTYGGTYDEQRFSQLKEITTANVKDVGLTWFADYDSNLQQQTTPLFIDGVLYVSLPWSKVLAFDAASGQQLWAYDPKTDRSVAPKICCGVVNRGLAAYNGKIYVGTLDGFLIAIDAKSGQEVWRKLTIDNQAMYSVTGAPRIANGKVFIGNAGSEFGVRGYLGAYDAETGEQLWRFYTVPGNPANGFENAAMEMAAKTWGGEWWGYGGGGTVWDAIVYDEVNNLVMFGTGNGSPWNRQYRDPTGGDNLFVTSIVAINADTGEYAWHYQTTPGDTWDYDSVSPMMLVDLNWQGSQRRVLIQPCKNGMFYVLDAATGALLKADPFTTLNWNTGVDLVTGRPNIVPEARFEEAAFNLAPGVQGAHGWHANAYNPDTGLVYIATQDAWYVLQSAATFQFNPRGGNTGLAAGAGPNYYRDNPTAQRGFVGYLQAWDPVTGKQVWRGEDNQGPTGGALATAGGLIFQGGGTNNDFRAYDAKTGEKLWSIDAQTPVLAPPISFELNGVQHIAISVGGNNASNYYQPNHSRLLVFKVGGQAQLPPAVTFTAPALNPPPAVASAEEVSAGEQHYVTHCAMCHGVNGQQTRATFPNLLVSPMLHSQEGFDQIVLQGVRTDKGMGSFADRLQAPDTATIRAYLIAQAHAAVARQAAAAVTPATVPPPTVAPTPAPATAPTPAADGQAEHTGRD